MNSPPLERYLSPKQVETMFNLPVTSLENGLLKMGPLYMKCGKHIRYKPEEVEKWMEKQRILNKLICNGYIASLILRQYDVILLFSQRPPEGGLFCPAIATS